MPLISKYSDINRNLFVLGVDVLCFLKKRDYRIEQLFQECKKTKNYELNQFLNIITFLWLLELINVNNNVLSINKVK